MRRVLRGLASAAVVWQVLWVVSQPGLWPQSQPTTLATVAMVGVTLMVVLLAVQLLVDRSSPRPWIVRVNTVMLVTAVAVAAFTQARRPDPDWHAVTELAALTAGVGGILIGTRVSIGLTLTLAGLVVAGVVFPFSGEPHVRIDGWIDPAYVLAVGLSAAAARRALVRSASETDLAQEALAVTAQRRRTTEAIESSLRATERLLHEQVLNTLVALARGGLSGLSADRLRQRCADGARMLSSLTSWGAGQHRSSAPTGDLVGDLASTLSELRDSGIEVSIDVDDLTALPGEVRDALRTATREALSNVLRHSRAGRVELTAQCESRRHGPAVRVLIADDGRGLVDGDWAPGFGVQDAILRSMSEVGGTAEVVSGADGGVHVELGWQAPRHTDSALMAPIVQPSALAIPVLAALGLYVAAQIAVTWPFVANTGLDLAAAGLWALLALVVAVQTTRGSLTWPMVVAVGAIGWIVYLVQEAAFVGTDRGGWASPAIAALFLVVAATGPSWGWVALTAIWLGIQGDPLYELTQPGTAMILVGAILGRSLRGNARRAGESRDEEIDVAAQESAARHRVERFSRRFAALEYSGAAELLAAVAAGTAEPSDPDVRSRAAREERYVRNIMLTDPQIDGLHRLVTDLVVAAHQRDVLLDIALSPEVVLPEDIDETSVREFVHAMANAEPSEVVAGEPTGYTARFTSMLEGDTVTVRMVVPMAPGVGGPPGVLIDRAEDVGELWLWQVDVPHAPSTPVGSVSRLQEAVS